MIKYLILLAALLIAGLAYIATSRESHALQEINSNIVPETPDEWKPLRVTGDAVPWELFATTKEHESCSQKDEEGYDICLIKPEYSEKIRQLDGKEVTLMGYMFPLDQADKQKTFLIGPYPLSCPFHYHVGPAQIVEVLAAKPQNFSYDPITIRGTLKLRFNAETGIFYYLEKAK